jgi:N-acetylglutamate synthase-like GNAT family acetyltransferase
MMKLRPIEKSDISSCVEIYKMTNILDNQEYWFSLLRDELEAAFEPSKFVQPKYFVVEDNDKVIGFGGYCNCGYDVQAFGLTWCNVNPDYKNQGVGKMLVQARLEAIANEGGKKVFAGQQEDVTWHLERFGFERLEKNEIFEGKQYWTMRKNL